MGTAKGLLGSRCKGRIFYLGVQMTITDRKKVGSKTGRDCCQTPGYALKPILSYLTQFYGPIWEPACGDGILGAELNLAFSNRIIETDILTGDDFFQKQPDNWDVQVTNPPYSVKYKWIKRSYELGKPFALLMPVDVIGAKTAQLLFAQYGVEIILMDKRINYIMPHMGLNGHGAHFSSAWFTWGLSIGQQLTFAHLEVG
jgi:hypothetical protein